MDLTTLTTPAASFGAPEWVFFVAQIVVALAGGYFAFAYSDANPVRKTGIRTIGMMMFAVGLIGVLVGGLRLGGVAPFTMPIWITIATVLNVALAAYAAYFLTSVLPQRVAASVQSSRKPGVRPTQRSSGGARQQQAARPVPPKITPINGSETEGEAGQPVAASGRRSSRRDRKRKHR